MDIEKIGLFIADLRKESKMTQKDLAEKLNVTIQAVSKWERGIGIPDISLFKPLGEIFKISVIELMEGERIKENDINIKVDNIIINTLKHSQKEKRKIKKNTMIVILLTVLMSAIITYIGINSAKNNNNANSFLTEKNAFLEKEDGWIYVLNVSKEAQDNKNHFYFNGYNLRYQAVEDFIINDYYNQNIIPYLSGESDDYKKETLAIDKFFTEKQFTEKIKQNDLKDLKISLINKEDLVYLYNQLLSNKKKDNWGRYQTMPEMTIKEYVFGNDYKWTIGYLIDYGIIKYVDIELVYSNGEHLSDLVKKEKVAIEQVAIEKNIKLIEKYIVEKKVFDIQNNLKEIEPYKTLKNRLLIELDSDPSMN